jgi:hypothetical protein
MPATAASQCPPAVDQPGHPLHALTTSELTGYRRQLEHAIAWSDAQDPVPPARTSLQSRLADVIAEQDDRARIARA